MVDVADENFIISPGHGARVLFKHFGIADVAAQRFYRTVA
jgi:hypothetical protein